MCCLVSAEMKNGGFYRSAKTHLHRNMAFDKGSKHMQCCLTEIFHKLHTLYFQKRDHMYNYIIKFNRICEPCQCPEP